MNRERMWNNGTFRVTHHINRRPAVNIHHAARYSEVIGFPLNRFVTVNFALTECSPDRASHTFRKMLAQRFAPWLRRTGGNHDSVRPTYVWTMEAGGRQLAAHWLVHVPSGLQRAFERKLSDWLDSVIGAAPEDRAIDVRPITNLVGARRYVLKGIDPSWANHLRVRHVDQGIVVGKRSGFSRNLGPCARTRGGYRPKRVPFTSSAK